jgi:hypothetical protein
MLALPPDEQENGRATGLPLVFDKACACRFSTFACLSAYSGSSIHYGDVVFPLQIIANITDSDISPKN